MQGVIIKALEPIMDDRGMLMEILREDDLDMHTPSESMNMRMDLINFGQCYLSTVQPGIVKAFHLHKKQTDRICCIKGNIKLVVAKPTLGGYCDIKVIYLGERDPKIVKIGPDIWHGWTPIDDQEAFILNLPDRAYDYNHPDEWRTSYDKWYDWEVRNK